MTQADCPTAKITVHKLDSQVQTSHVAFQWPALKYEKITKDHQKLKKAFTMKDRPKQRGKKKQLRGKKGYRGRYKLLKMSIKNKHKNNQQNIILTGTSLLVQW